MSTCTVAAPGLLQQRSFVLFWFARLTSTIGYQMLALMIGWQIYEITGSALDLGFVGLIQFVPAAMLTLLIGHVADRYNRRLVVRASHGVYALAAAFIILGLLAGGLGRNSLFACVFLTGCARAFEMPTSHALAPTLVPEPLVPRAVAAWTSANQTAVICGPALGGLIYVISPYLIAVASLVCFACSITLVTLVQLRGPVKLSEPPTLGSVLAGFQYIRTRRRLIGVITLDLFVVILGGATALLPIYAKDILAVGPAGLGLLRSAPAVGALITSIVLARYPVERHIGRRMFTVVVIYGLATIIFGLSTSLPISLLALLILGAADAVSIVIRFSLVQIETPDEKRGRVSAINYLFVGSSNTLGEFESGLLAAWVGTIPSVVIGGIGSLLIAGIWMILFPDLRRIDRFQPADQTQMRS
ncbi:MAG TPA: MFS transporter [Pseudolabrys sp.]|nr:MFS transporter [Pseudolabrys sp.]